MIALLCAAGRHQAERAAVSKCMPLACPCRQRRALQVCGWGKQRQRAKTIQKPHRLRARTLRALARGMSPCRRLARCTARWRKPRPSGRNIENISYNRLLKNCGCAGRAVTSRRLL